MRLFFGLLSLLIGLFSANGATAQRRSTNELLLLPEVQTEVALQGDDYLLATFNLSRQTQRRGSTFAAGQLRLGYEHFWNERWSGGATLRLVGGSNGGEGYGDLLGLPGKVTPGVLLRHASEIRAFNFSQRLGVEYVLNLDGSSGANNQNTNRALTRLRFALDRLFSVGGELVLRPRLAYEAAAYLRLQRDETETKERVIDFGNLRAEMGLRVSPHLDFTPWVATQTFYLNSLPQYDANGVQTGGGRTNFVTPTVGLDARLTLFGSEARPQRRQLATQH